MENLTERIADVAEVESVRVDTLTDRDVLAAGRDPGQDGFTAHPIAAVRWAGWSAAWGQEVWRVERADGRTLVQPGRFLVTIVRRDREV